MRRASVSRIRSSVARCGGAAGGELLDGGAQAPGQMSQGGLGGAYPARFEGGDIGGRVGGLGQLFLGEAPFGAQPQHAASDVRGLVRPYAVGAVLGHFRPSVRNAVFPAVSRVIS
ncbi:hypothetical protein GCM10020000_32640 [Streptomyces olivoverticillatus]